LAVAVVAGRRWKAVLGGTVGLAGWAAVTITWFWGPFLTWLDQRYVLIEMLRADGYHTWGIHSWFGFSNLLIYPWAPGLADLVTATLSLGTVAAVAVMWWRTRWQPGAPDWDAAMAVSMAVVPLAGVHLFVYDLALWMVPFLIVLALPACQRDDAYLDGGKVLGWTVAVYLASFLSSYLSLAQQSATTSAGWPAVAVQISVVTVVGWGFAVWSLARRGS
jgi:hypothetical protein